MTIAQELYQRLRAEYLEMPGLALRAEQIHRLCGNDRAQCDAALAALVREQFLFLRADGQYVRPTGERASHCRTANATIRPSNALGRAS